MAEDAAGPVRIDRWLFAARFYRSRSLAAQACEGGKVELDRRGVKPHKVVHPGDLLELTLPGGKRRLRVVATAEHRGPASIARQLYEDLTPPPPVRHEPAGERERGSGRPTKRERRRIDRWRAL